MLIGEMLREGIIDKLKTSPYFYILKDIESSMTEVTNHAIWVT